MTRKYALNRCLQFGLASFLSCGTVSILTVKTLAQQSNIVPDNTLGSESSQVLGNFQGQSIEIITGGATRGINLFHSFKEFNISADRAAYFFNSNAAIENILARVTGGNRSEILGKLGTSGSSNVNLFLMNPNGIVFGKDASLDVKGSFVGTTANGLAFGNQGVFSATNPNNPALLTINPTALFYNQIAATASIQNNSSATGLRVPDGKSLLLVGSDITMNNGDLFAFGGRVELGGLATPGTIELVSNNSNDLSLSFPANVQRADVSLSNGATVNVSAGGGGNIVVNARNLNITRSILNAGIEQGLASVGAQAGDITLNATGDIKVVQSNVFNDVISNQFAVVDNEGNILEFIPRAAYVNGGNINISSASFSLTDGAILSASTYGQGDAGSVKIDASGGTVTINNSRVSSNVSGSNFTYQGMVKSGGISITTGSLTVANLAELNSSTTGGGIGRAGDITIKARDQVLFNNGFAFSRLELGGIGKAGDISIATDGSVLVTGVPSNTADARIGQLVSATFGEGDAGSITIKAGNNVEFDGRGSDAYTLVAENRGVGNAGNITIDSRSLSVRNGARLVTNTESQGNAGSVNVIAKDSVSLNNGSILSSVNPSGNGKGGDINIDANFLSLTNGAEFATVTSGRGDAGNIKIKATNSVNISGTSSDRPSRLRTATERNSVGKGGNITASTQNLRVSDGGLLDARTENNSDGGSITLNVKQAEILNGGQVVSTSSSAGSAGKITINATDKVIINGSSRAFNDRVAPSGTAVAPIEASTGLFVRAQSTGRTGNIDVIAPQVRLDNTAQLNAESTLSSGGDINLKSADLLLLRRGSRISTSAGTAGTGGDGGNININSKYIIAVPKENSDISANAYKGAGGAVNIVSKGIFGIESQPKPTEKSDITASSELGISGTININTLDTSTIQNGLLELPTYAIDTNALIANSCISRGTKRQENSFTITGSGALPNNRPGNVLVSNYTTGSVRGVETTSRPWKKGDPIIEPQGVYQLNNGQLLLSRECSN
jgi:filamentous hemagglutinin family protein